MRHWNSQAAVIWMKGSQHTQSWCEKGVKSKWDFYFNDKKVSLWRPLVTMNSNLMLVPSPLFMSRSWVLGSLLPFHSSLTVPMSHHEYYNEWWDKAEIGIHCLQWPPQAHFWVMGGYEGHLSHLHCSCQDCGCWESYSHFTAAWLFQCLIMSIMNGETRLRLEFIVCNGLHKLTFESWVGKKVAFPISTVHVKIVLVGILAPISQQLDCSNVSSWV